MHVVATAGHVDHGKSTLVKALTGQDPDRLAEERRRGLSIRLGYCWTTLPGVGEVALVDVPGHSKFLSTTLAGLGPVPAAMLVVAADDPWMPQAAEHLAALDLLGVRHGLLVVTRTDLADPAPALARAREQLAGTSLHDAPDVVVSGRTGAGMDDLREALARLVSRLPIPDPQADVRLWLDRGFHVRGTGTVVTGTLQAGTVRRGDLLETGSGGRVRVRGLESLGARVEEVRGVARVALDLGGRTDPSVAHDGVLVTPGAFEPTRMVDVRLQGERRPPERPVLHLGAAALGVRVRPLSGDLVRLTLPRPLPLRLGDRALLRDPGSRTLWGVTVLDPLPPVLERRGAAALRAEALRAADGTIASELARRGATSRSLLRRLGADGDVPPDAVTAGDWLLDGARAAALVDRLPSLVEELGTATRRGVPLARLAAALDLPGEGLVEALALRAGEALRLVQGVVSPAREALPPRLATALESLQHDLATAPFAAPTADRLHELGLGPGDLALLARAGKVLRLDGTVVLAPDTDERAIAALAVLPAPFTASQARAAWDTSRRVALPLLTHLDRTGRTVRLPDDRRRLRSSP